jgi:hypothetical protein
MTPWGGGHAVGQVDRLLDRDEHLARSGGIAQPGGKLTAEPM